jgi:hypothetical protein
VVTRVRRPRSLSKSGEVCPAGRNVDATLGEGQFSEAWSGAMAQADLSRVHDVRRTLRIRTARAVIARRLPERSTAHP